PLVIRHVSCCSEPLCADGITASGKYPPSDRCDLVCRYPSNHCNLAHCGAANRCHRGTVVAGALASKNAIEAIRNGCGNVLDYQQSTHWHELCQSEPLARIPDECRVGPDHSG